jgi:hypothetical protein
MVGKLDRLFNQRTAARSVERLRMLSISFNFSTERATGAWTETLQHITRFSGLTYLEVCIKYPKRLYNGDHLCWHVPDAAEAFRSLPRLLSLSVHDVEVVRDLQACLQQLQDFLGVITTQAELQHLLLPATQPWSAITPTLVRRHAATLVSLRIHAGFLLAAARTHTFPRLSYLRLLTSCHAAGSDAFEVLLSRCPNLAVLWLYEKEERPLRNILEHLPASTHTLVARFVTDPGGRMQVGVARPAASRV